MIYDYAIKNGTLYLDDSWIKTNLYIKGEKISYIGSDERASKEIIDATGKLVMPGFIDPHVHFELHCGDYTSSDDFYYGSKSAAYGGVSTIVDFLDPTGNAKDLHKSFVERKKLASKSLVDYHLHACLKDPDGNLEEYVKEMLRLKITTVKIFTTYSDSNRRTYDKDIIKLLKLSKKYKFLIEAHIENDQLISLQDDYTFRDLSTKSRTSISETSEALKLASYVRKYGGYLYMVHLSSGKTLEELMSHYPDILHKNFIVESCPQYLAFNNELLQSKTGYLYTFAPPLRSLKEQISLINNFSDIDTIGTDHCPFNKRDKKRELLVGAPLGIGGVEYAFTTLRDIVGDEVIDKMSKNNAFYQGFKNKGTLEVGKDADIVIYEEKENYMNTHPHGNSDYSVYEGLYSNGEVVSLLVRGKFVLKNRRIHKHTGKYIESEALYEGNH